MANLLNPVFLKDPKYRAAEELLKKLHKELIEKTVSEVIYPRIDEITDEQLLDLLAWQFHIEGWELAKTVEEKRELIKRAIELHRHKGTKYAVLRVLEALGLKGEVKEWFEYNGKPYYFKVEVNSPSRQITPELRSKLIRLIKEYKNERSWLEEFILSYLATGAVYCGIGTIGETENSSRPYTDGFSFPSMGTFFAIAGSVGETESESKPYTDGFAWPARRDIASLAGSLGETESYAKFTDVIQYMATGLLSLNGGNIGEVETWAIMQ